MYGRTIFNLITPERGIFTSKLIYFTLYISVSLRNLWGFYGGGDLRPSWGVQGHAPPEESVVHLKGKCIKLVHLESKITKLPLWKMVRPC